MVQQFILTCELDDAELREMEDMLARSGRKYSIAVMSKGSAEQRLFRFEWFFDGERQHIGLFNMLDELEDLTKGRNWMQFFAEKLPVPIKIKEPCCFWFTEEGLERFGLVIEEINGGLKDMGWELRVACILAHESAFLYQDDLQVALDEEVLNDDLFEEFISVEVIRMQEAVQ